MTLNKIKRGKEWVDKDLFNNNVNANWGNYQGDYDFGKNIDFNKMNDILNYMLTGINDGSIIYNPTSGNTYSFTLNGNNPDWDHTSPEAKYTIGYLGKYLRDAAALQEDPWNANTYYSDLLKLKYWKGQEANNDLLLTLSQDLKISTYKNMIDIFKSGIDGIPEDLREDYLNFWDKASGFMDNGLIDPDELNDLYRYTGLTFNWLKTPESKVEKVPDTPVSPAKVKQEQPTTVPETKKEIVYEDHYTLDLSKGPEQAKIDKVDALDNATFTDILRKAINSPEKYPDVLPYLMRKISKVSKEDIIDLRVFSPNYKFFFDKKNKKIIKSHKSNFAVHENVETTKSTDKEETKPENQT